MLAERLRQQRYPESLVEFALSLGLTYGLSLRELSAALADRGVAVSHQTLATWYKAGRRVRRLPDLSSAESYLWELESVEAVVAGSRVQLAAAVSSDGLLELVVQPPRSRTNLRAALARLLRQRRYEGRPLSLPPGKRGFT